MLPTGTVTFLFTDIEGSTRLWEAFPEQMKQAFARHETIIREAVAARGGYLYKMIGDAFQVAFSSARAALLAAVDIQRGLTAEPWGEVVIKVRIALHTGVTEERGDDYVGPILNRLARILVAGHGGQLLISQVTWELVVDQAPEDVFLKDLGLHNLKDLVRPEHIYQVVAPGLSSDFPPLRTINLLPNNLPLQLTSFIGREKEMAELRSLLERKETRLVTLTGTGGTGKTRLSIQIAAEVLELYRDGTWLVELARINDPEQVPKMVAAVLDIRETTEKPFTTALIDYLRSKQLLLILDNCEHVVEACATLVDTLLRACPNLQIMTSSREILGIGGEIPFRVPSLSTPDLRHLPALEQLAQSEAVRLFVERAQAALTGFALTQDNAAYVAQVVKRLDGIPLAIELAAARVRLLSPAQIASRLDDAFRLLTGGSRAVLPRHQTLRALIDWSYNLLSSKEIVLLRRLSVFSGGWTLEAAEAVCVDPPGTQSLAGLAAVDVLEVLTQLVDKSLVFCYDETGEVLRYRMMDTIRQYAHEKLMECGESQGVRDQHLAYFLGLAEASEPHIRTGEQVAWLNRLEGSLDNLRLALEWSLQMNLEAELRLASALFWFWHIRGLAWEAMDWLNQGIAKDISLSGDAAAPVGATTAVRPEARAKALLALGGLLAEYEHPSRAMPLLEKSMAIYSSLGPTGKAGIANVYRWMASCSFRKRNYERAQKLAQEAIELFREIGDKFGLSECLTIQAPRLSNPEERKKAYLDVLALKREIGDIDGIAYTLQNLSHLAFVEGDYQNAAVWLDESLERFREVGNRTFTATDLHNKATISWSLGDYDQGIYWIQEALDISRDSGDDRHYAISLLREGEIAVSKGDIEFAGQVYAEVLRYAQDAGNRRMIGSALASQGVIDWLSGRLAQAEEHWQAALSIGHETHFRPLVFTGLFNQGKAALWRGDYSLAQTLLRQSLRLMIEMNDWVNIAHPLEVFASLAQQQQDPVLAARLFGAANHLFRLVANTLSQPERDRRAQDLAALRSALGEERFATLWREGEDMTHEQIQACVLDEKTPG